MLVLKYLSTARPLAGLLAEVPPPNSSGSIGLSMAAVLGSLLFEVLLYTLLGWCVDYDRLPFRSRTRIATCHP